MKIMGIPLSKFTIKNFFSWLRGNIIGKELKQEYIEQVMYRMTNENCQVCLEQGKCIHCGCDTFKKMLDPYSECAGVDENGNPYWGPMLSAKAWRDAKNVVGLKFYSKNTKEVDSNGK